MIQPEAGVRSEKNRNNGCSDLLASTVFKCLIVIEPVTLHSLIDFPSSLTAKQK